VKRRFPFLLAAVVVALALLGGGYWRWYEWRDHSQDAPILAAARRYSVDPALVKAVVWRESRFNARACGSKGELGLMQIMPAAAARDWAQAQGIALPASGDLFNPVTNTLVGAWYLDRLLRRYSHTDNPAAYALADYNAGRSNVLKWERGAALTNSAAFLAQINFPGVRGYVSAVLKRYEHYRPIFPARN